MEKKTIKKSVACFLSVLLCLSFTFQASAADSMTKGLLVYDATMLQDAADLRSDEIIFTLTTTGWLGNRAGVEYYLKQVKYTYGFKTTVILVNDYQTSRPELLPQDADSSKYYFMFNVFDDTGRSAVSSYFTSVASGLDGMVDRYIIGNEIQDQLWNYIGPMDVGTYCARYADMFTVAYNCIKSADSDAEVYIPFDYGWNNTSDNSLKYNAKLCLSYLSSLLPEEMDWGIAWHAYPDPMTSPVFWDDAYCTDSEDTVLVNLKNLHVLTDYMQHEGMLKSDGSVRNLILSEQGFTSSSSGVSDESMQAAAYAAGYFIAKSNPYVKAYILNRQVDDLGEVAQDHAFGIWNCDSSGKASGKKYIWQIFRDIDNESANQYIRDLVYEKTGMQF